MVDMGSVHVFVNGESGFLVESFKLAANIISNVSYYPVF